MEDDKEIRERRNSKWYDNFMENNRLGYLIDRSIFKYIPKKEEYKRFQEELFEIHKQGILDRFKRKRDNLKKNILPLNHQIIISIHRRKLMKQIIQTMNVLFNLEDVYQYDPICNGMGYKYYKGEQIIIYQIDQWMPIIEKSRIEKQIEKKKVMNKNKEIYDITNVYKIVIIKNTKWNKKNMKDWYEYKVVKNGYCAMLNIVTYNILEEGKILDQSKEMNQIMKELDRRFL